MAEEIGEQQQLLCHSIFTSAKTGYGLTVESRHALHHGVDATGEAPTLDKLIMQAYYSNVTGIRQTRQRDWVENGLQTHDSGTMEGEGLKVVVVGNGAIGKVTVCTAEGR